MELLSVFTLVVALFLPKRLSPRARLARTPGPLPVSLPVPGAVTLQGASRFYISILKAYSRSNLFLFEPVSIQAPVDLGPRQKNEEGER